MRPFLFLIFLINLGASFQVIGANLERVTPQALANFKFTYTDALDGLQECDATYDSKLVSEVELKSSVQLFDAKWERRTHDLTAEEACVATAADLSKRRRDIGAEIDAERLRIAQMQLPRQMKKMKLDRLEFLSLQKYLVEQQTQYSLAKLTSPDKPRTWIAPLLANYHGRSIAAICQSYARLVDKVADTDADAKLDMLIQKHVRKWGKSANPELLAGYRETADRACALAWQFWNRCVTDQFGNETRFGDRTTKISTLQRLFQSLKCHAVKNS